MGLFPVSLATAAEMIHRGQPQSSLLFVEMLFAGLAGAVLVFFAPVPLRLSWLDCKRGRTGAGRLV